MSEETYRPRKMSMSDLGALGGEPPTPNMTGTPPPAFAEALKEMQAKMAQEHPVAAASAEMGIPPIPQPAVQAPVAPDYAPAPPPPPPTYQQNPAYVPHEPVTPPQNWRPPTQATPMGAGDIDGILTNNPKFLEIMNRIDQTTHHYEEIVLPSLGKFYDGTDGPTNGILHIRQMTGKEEEILGQTRLVKQGKVMDKIFEKCIRETISAERLLNVDRTYILIFLRAISYQSDYDVEIKCPDCSKAFNTTINLADLDKKDCPDGFGPESLEDVLPSTKLRFGYRLPRAYDDASTERYREKFNKEHGDNAENDTAFYRLALMIKHIEGVSDPIQIRMFLKKLPSNDLNYLRNLIGEPPFGVETLVDMLCPLCFHEFKLELPFDQSFFSPRQKKTVPKT